MQCAAPMRTYPIRLAAQQIGIPAHQLRTRLHCAGGIYRDTRTGEWRATKSWIDDRLLVEHYGKYQPDGAPAQHYCTVRVTEKGLEHLFWL
jgi:hypothetical protein